MKGLQLLATGGALPGRVVTNEDLRRQVDTSDEWITTQIGRASVGKECRSRWSPYH